MKKMKEDFLYGKSFEELQKICHMLDVPSYTATQLCSWLYRRHADSVEEMTNLSLKTREKLKERYTIGRTPPLQVQVSTDGTKKYLFAAMEKHFIEVAYIPDRDRATLCMSTQAGCRMGCKFCMTGKQGFQGNLSVTGILNQLGSLPERNQITNLVYMGMGEPLDNLDNTLKSLNILTSPWGFGWSPKRITVSTVGLLPALQELLTKSRCHIAISLHSPFDEERQQIMPVQIKHPLGEILEVLKKHPFGHQRRLSFEYILFKDFNDSDRHLKALIRMFSGMRCRINLIRFHAFPGTHFEGAAEQRFIYFRDTLNAKGIIATIRASRGRDIDAACGMLSTKKYYSVPLSF